ncbi:TPA: hypothetical protein PXO89_003666 [Yersinia enterocolitica]|nr:hypothetical protein [Yersinia enterocolitica]HDL8027033.1 hypothetical protein [Yersinia enterocolitica]HDL8314092.1 hypothetical protein [Yersinia enterocolitica]
MDFEKRLALYEKLYFNENETKEKLHARVQGVFAFALIIATVISYIFKNITYSSVWLSFTIIILNVAACSFLGYALWLLKKAFWGNEYAIFFTPKEISDLLVECREHSDSIVKYNNENPFSSVSDVDANQLLDEMVCERFELAATNNIDVNLVRSDNIHKAIHKMFVSLIPLTLAMVVFLIGNLDSSAPRNSSLVETKVIVIGKSVIF